MIGGAKLRLSLENCRNFTLKRKSKEFLGSEVRFKKNHSNGRNMRLLAY